jgi:hypothetical protein
MRSFLVAFALSAMFATAVQAADNTSPIVGQFPDTASNLHVYLFTLKENDLSLSMGAQEFCSKMDYGEAVFWHRPDEVGEDHKVAPGKLEWVICRFKGK